MNSLKIHIKDKYSFIAVNGTEISNVLAYEVKQDSDHWGAHVAISASAVRATVPSAFARFFTLSHTVASLI